MTNIENGNETIEILGGLINILIIFSKFLMFLIESQEQID